MDIIKQLFLGILGISIAIGLFVLATHQDKAIRKLAWAIIGFLVLGSIIYGTSN